MRKLKKKEEERVHGADGPDTNPADTVDSQNEFDTNANDTLDSQKG